jgi:pimeloyl-ACP methyl ester carboxylesterase
MIANKEHVGSAGAVTSKDGTRIAFERAGSGPAVILVDGALCSRAMGPMPSMATLLAAHFTVYVYDRRGRGESGDALTYEVEREIEDIAALIADAGGSASLFGISSGAVLALEAADRLPSVVKLALYEAPLIVDDSRTSQPEGYLDQMRGYLAEHREGDALKMFMRLVGVPAPVVFIMPFTPMWSKAKRVAHTLPYDFTIIGDKQKGKPLPPGTWSSVKVPTLAAVGGNSPVWLHHAMRAVADVVPSAQLRTIPGQTHNVKAQVLAPVVAEFLRG